MWATTILEINHLKKGSVSLDSIYEEVDISNKNSQDCSSLVVEWAHERLPLPMQWVLSPIPTNS